MARLVTGRGEMTPLQRVGARMAEKDRAIVRRFLDQLERVEWPTEPAGFWRDAGHGVEQWVTPR